MTPRTYDLYLPASFKFWIAFVVVFSVAIPVVLLGLVGRPGGPPLFVPLALLAALALVWFHFLSLPHRIVVHDDGRIEFAAVVRTRTIAASDIVAVRPHRSQFGFLVFRLVDGKVVVPNQFTGFHQLLSELAARHTGIQMLGC